MTPDVNVLVAAFRRDHPHHRVALDWLARARTSCARGSATLSLLPIALMGFLRLVTHPRVFADPDPIEDAVSFVDALIGSPGVEVRASEIEWPLVREKLLTRRLQGNFVTDAWIAAATEAHSEHLVTFDRDFKRLLPAREFTLLASAP
ncbi:MAG TPA: TA system VapC family ribonuclease toxin [Burkholderiales bacterium]|nr:TA system VapC family ribonuclease toxin [Burkholderiales bacterium]